MGQFSIRQASIMLKIPRDTLRYYDKMGLVCPIRGDNNYRYYTQQDIFDLQYIQVLSFAGFSLSEIGRLFEYMRACDINNFPLMLQILKNKREDLAKRVLVFQSMINYIDETEAIISSETRMGENTMAKIGISLSKMLLELKELKEELK